MIGNGEELLDITHVSDILALYILTLKLQSKIERVKAGMGELTGTRLDNCVLMIMMQTAVRTLLVNNKTESVKLLNIIN